MAQKIVINRAWGGFTIPESLLEVLGAESIYDSSVERTNPILVAHVESIDYVGDLIVVSIPDDVEWHVANYDGMEHVAEDHRTWG